MSRVFRVFLVALAALITLSAGAMAQVTGRLTGSVVDPSGAAVPQAIIEVFLSGGSKPLASTKTSEDGLFTIAALQPGIYRVSVTAPGLDKKIIEDVRVETARELGLGLITLKVASASQAVEVEANATTVQTTDAQVSNTITKQQIEALPVLDRQVSSLFLTQPGVTSGRGPTVVNGLRTSAASVTLEGINVQDNFIRTNSLDYLPGKTTIEQVREVTITTANGATSNGSGAVQIAQTIPSGGNQFHGSVYWYNRNNYFAANQWYNNQTGVNKPFLNQNQAGFSVSGPVIKDKLFFYFNYEAYRNRQQNLNTTTVLTPNARNGIFTYVDRNGATQQVNVLALRGVSIDPAITNLLSQVPTTINNRTVGDGLNTGGYSFNARANEDRNSITAKGDYTLSVRHQFSAAWVWNTDKLDRPDLINNYAAQPAITNDNKNKLLSGSWRWNPAPTLTNEVRGGFNLSPGTFNVADKYPSYFLAGLPFSNPYNAFLAQGRNTNTYSIQDNANWFKGSHTIRFGFQSQFIRTAPYNDAGIVPIYTLGLSTANTTGLKAADLPGIRSQADLNTANSLYSSLGGIISGAAETFNITSPTSGFVPGARNIRHLAFDEYAFYVQDDWKINPRLTVNLGLRYDYYTPVREEQNLFTAPVLENGNYIQTLLDPNAKIDFVKGNYYNPDRNNFAPNIGFAWDLFGGDRKTVLRGGYSIFYFNDDTITTVNNNLTTTAGTTSPVTLSNLVGKVTNALPNITTPTFTLPLSNADLYATNSGNALGLINPNLVTPYAQEWNLGVEQSVFGGVFSVRYVGNHATKLLRAFDYNQVQIQNNGFLTDFLKAQQNGNLALAATGTFDPRYNAKITGSQPLPVFNQLASGGLLTNSTVIAYIRQGEPGTLAQVYQTNGLNGSINFFQNYNALGTNSVNNFSNSTYHSVQLDFRKDTRYGLHLQANYVFSKVLSDEDGTGQTRFEPFLDASNSKIERARAPFDLTHVIKSNAVIPIPVGRNRHFLNQTNRVVDAVVGGWNVSGIMTYESGTPFSILSGRGTLNRGSRSGQNTALTFVNKSQLDQVVGFFMTGNGPSAVNPSAIGPDGRGVAADGATPFTGQVFFNPPAGTLGTLQRRMFNGPWDFQLDMSLQKNFAITERQTLQFRADAFNLPNHPSFYVGTDPNINSTTFGLANVASFNSARIFQFGLYYRF